MNIMPKEINNQRGIIQVVVILIVLIGIGIGLYLISNPQIFKPKAFTSNPISGPVDPSSSPYVPTQNKTACPRVYWNNLPSQVPLETSFNVSINTEGKTSTYMGYVSMYLDGEKLDTGKVVAPDTFEWSVNPKSSTISNNRRQGGQYSLEFRINDWKGYNITDPNLPQTRTCATAAFETVDPFTAQYTLSPSQPKGGEKFTITVDGLQALEGTYDYLALLVDGAPQRLEASGSAFVWKSEGLKTGKHEAQLVAHCDYLSGGTINCNKQDLVKFNPTYFGVGGFGF